MSYELRSLLFAMLHDFLYSRIERTFAILSIVPGVYVISLLIKRGNHIKEDVTLTTTLRPSAVTKKMVYLMRQSGWFRPPLW